MLKHPRVTEARIARAVALVKERIYADRAALGVEAFREQGEPVFPARIPEQGYKPFRMGESWGPAWSTVWFRFSGTVPAGWSREDRGRLVRLGYRGGEGLPRRGWSGRRGGQTRAINVNRAEVPVAASARGGEQVSFLVEAAANPEREDRGCRTAIRSRAPAGRCSCWSRRISGLFRRGGRDLTRTSGWPTGA